MAKQPRIVSLGFQSLVSEVSKGPIVNSSHRSLGFEKHLAILVERCTRPCKSAVSSVIAVATLAGLVQSPYAKAQGNATKDPAAVSALTNAIVSMGGQASLGTIHDATFLGQSLGPPTDSSSAAQITLKSIGTGIRCETALVNTRTVYTSNNGTGYLEDPSGTVSPLDSRLALSIAPLHLPGVIFLYLLDAPDQSLSVVQDVDPSIVHIRTMKQLSDPDLESATQQDWYINTKTGLPSRVDYVIPNAANSSQDSAASEVFTSWQKTAVALVPQSIQILQNGAVRQTVTFGAPAFNQGLSETIFTLP